MRSVRAMRCRRNQGKANNVMVSILLLALSLSGFSALNLTIKLAGMHGIRSIRLLYLLFTLAGGLMLAVAGLHGELKAWSWWLVGVGLAGGLGGAAAVHYVAKAYQIGHYGFTATAGALSSFLPALFAVVVYDAPFGWMEISGLVLLTLALGVLATATREGAHCANAAQHRRWLVLMILTLVLNGTVGVAQTIFDKRHDPRIFLFLACVYFGGTLLFTPLLFRELRQVVTDRRTLRWALLATACSVVGMITCQLALKRVSPVIVFPVVLVAPVFVGLAVSRAVFKERVSPAGYVGIVLALAGVLLLSGLATQIGAMTR